MDMSAGRAGSDTTGPPNPKDTEKKRNRCGAAKKRARKAKAERELGLAPRVDATSNVSAPQPGGSLVGPNDCGGETGDKDGSAPINLKRRRNETVTPPEIRKQKIAGNQIGLPLYQRPGCSSDSDSYWGNKN
ncbi:hypothetical protein PV328_001059 [Microctonus aethiopoides]|uniref:Uncharacterized protein n=1 Tax=Microctonus aethiopoides TaxID=144406 RepID=A0AA39FWN6_9HYME|nr:hypothetical protein PV328_001059 [Microctonus aethiopoides]